MPNALSQHKTKDNDAPLLGLPKGKAAICLGVILLVAGLCFSPTLKNDFIYLDDDTHLLENPAVRGLDSAHIQRMFTTTVNKTYIPLTFLSFAVEYHFFKYDPFIYHLNNLLLHLCVTALVFYFAIQMGLPLRAAFVAGLLFGIHPMHVESVAWVTERKDVLYAFFYMLALCFYWKYLEKKDIRFYGATLVFGILSILSKPMALSLPLILLVCDWFKRRPLDQSMILDKIPHFLYIVPIAWITYSLNARLPGESLDSGLLIWLWTSAFYISKFFFPVILAPMYDLPEPVTLANPHYWGALTVWTGIAAALFVFRRQRWLWFAALFYFVSMFFLFRYDDAADKNIVADRFMYLPCLGICFLIGYSIDQLYRKLNDNKSRIRVVLTVVLIIIGPLLGAKTYHQTLLWRSSILFWSHQLKYYPDNALAYGNRGEAYKDIGKMDLAMADFNRSIVADPNYAESYNSRGQLYGMSGQFDAAMADFNKAIALNPRFDEAYSNIGMVYAMKKDFKQASVYFKKALDIDPDNEQARGNYNAAMEFLNK